ncbi:MAG: hypothetical protein PUC32_04785, partial [Oscillospiraceae bacterium]|nr:hypothetical protein [Oscillospiraceae bacterium]
MQCKRILCSLLASLMLASSVPLTVFASQSPEELSQAESATETALPEGFDVGSSAPESAASPSSNLEESEDESSAVEADEESSAVQIAPEAKAKKDEDVPTPETAEEANIGGNLVNGGMATAYEDV